MQKKPLFDIQSLPLSDKEKILVQQASRPLHFGKDDTVFIQGDVCRDIYIIRTGLVKLSYTTLNGKELIKSFITEGGLFGSLYSQITGEGSTYSATALEALHVDVMDFSVLQDISDHNQELQKVFLHFFQQLALAKEIREYELLCLSAQQRYEKFCAQNPQLLTRLKQADLALYLGITPIALSRLKHRAKTDPKNLASSKISL